MTMNVYQYYQHRAALERVSRQLQGRRPVAFQHLFRRGVSAVARPLVLLLVAGVVLSLARQWPWAALLLLALAVTAEGCRRLLLWLRRRIRLWARAWSGRPLGEEGIRQLLG